jgi:hypothetical protein
MHEREVVLCALSHVLQFFEFTNAPFTFSVSAFHDESKPHDGAGHAPPERGRRSASRHKTEKRRRSRRSSQCAIAWREPRSEVVSDEGTQEVEARDAGREKALSKSGVYEEMQDCERRGQRKWPRGGTE